MDDRDREAAVEAWMASAESPASYDFSFRVHDGTRTRWIAARGDGAPSNRPDGTVLAVFVDVTAQKGAEEAERLVAREMVHRIGNLFGVASAVVSLTARSVGSVEEFVDTLRARFAALNSGFLYAVGASGRLRRSVGLGAIITELVEPYRDKPSRIEIDVPDAITVNTDKITDVAMTVHELATNAAKHSALSVPEGRIRVAASFEGECLVLDWHELDGPPLTALPETGGFGTTLLERTVRGSLGGRIERRLTERGLAVRIEAAGSGFGLG